MSAKDGEEKIILPHHEQQKLCTTRLPYRQGRKLTAVKVYTVNNESNHLLIFGVPSLKLHDEVKTLFSNFGKLLQFTITTNYPTEAFTENYHAVFEKIHAARMAKKNLDTNNFYGGSLHVCYAPELEKISETRRKLFQRQKDVLNRLKSLRYEAENVKKDKETAFKTEETLIKSKKLNMGEVNVIGVGKHIKDVFYNKNKRKMQQQHNGVIEKQFKPCFQSAKTIHNIDPTNSSVNTTNIVENNSHKSEIDIIDCTSVETETITNINESLNYKEFGNEIIKKLPQKPVNRIKFNVFNKKL